MSHFPVAVILPITTEERADGDRAVYDQLLPYMENCCDEPPLEFMEFVEDEDCDVDERTGRRGYWQNPNAKWDWYVIGGRFRGKLRLRGGGRSDYAEIRDIDTSRDEPAYRAALAFWDYKVGGAEKPPAASLQDDSWKPEYYTERFGDRETFARFRSDFLFRAVVTPDRKWHEVGEMGWWGVSFETHEDIVDWLDHYHERFVRPYMDHMLVVVDCHI